MFKRRPYPDLPPETEELRQALAAGDPQRVADLVAAGADLHYRRSGGYDALIDAVHGRDIARDPRLLELLSLLIARGVNLSGVSRHNESGLRVLSRVGRFDAVRVLLDAGADRSQLGWTPLIEAVALGSLADVRAMLDAGAALEAEDWWSRTAWLVALLAGEIDKAQLLRERGANPAARGRCGKPALFYAIQGHHPEVLCWLLELGADVDQTDEHGGMALMEAVEGDDLECVEILLDAGADVDARHHGTPLGKASSRAVIQRLLEAGADPANLENWGQRILLGLPRANAELLASLPREEFQRGRSRVFGRSNPERQHVPFWDAMIRSGARAWDARDRFEEEPGKDATPVWCAERFGQSWTLLPGGRAVQVGGEHEDHYDPDFCIYNDVFVHEPDGSIAVYGYPEAVFPPTDFHTATHLHGSIYLIGSLGYPESRRPGETQVYRLDLHTLQMHCLETRGDGPGWISRHRAAAEGDQEIRVWNGKVVSEDGAYQPNPDVFVLDLRQLRWRRLPQG